VLRENICQNGTDRKYETGCGKHETTCCKIETGSRKHDSTDRQHNRTIANSLAVIGNCWAVAAGGSHPCQTRNRSPQWSAAGLENVPTRRPWLIRFAEKVLALLNQGSFTAKYKQAVLRQNQGTGLLRGGDQGEINGNDTLGVSAMSYKVC